MGGYRATLLLLAMFAAAPARAQSVADLQRQIDELKAMVAELRTALQTAKAAPAPAPAAAPPREPLIRLTKAAPPNTISGTPVPPRQGLTLRGYTQLRMSEIVAGDRRAPPGLSRLRSVADNGIDDNTNFTFRRIRLVLQGDLNEWISLYLQPDFATSVSNQSGGERRDGFGQLRDAYVDVFPDADRRFRLRFGQSKVPFGWENLQSSSNRVPLDRSDAINSGVPSERDLGIALYYTPPAVQRVWKRLTDDGQKLFGNYGAFGLAAYNGQGTNRVEANDGLMTVAMATWPFELGDQVLEVGGSAYRNRVKPELRAGGLSPVAYRDDRIGVHLILYPQPFGIQAEWNWGRGPEYDRAAQAIVTRSLEGGYVQVMGRVKHSPIGPLMPYARWQHYRGGWKALPNAPRLETDDIEVGVEWQPARPLELTIAYARMKRREPDERRTGRAEGDVIRTQLQWNY